LKRRLELRDPRIEKLAEVLLHYSIGIKEGDLLMIRGNYLTLPLIKELYKKALLAGANPYTKIGVDGIEEIFYSIASEEQLKFISKISWTEVEEIDALITIWGEWNTKKLSNVDPKRIALAQGARRPLFQKLMERIADGSVRWVGTQYPAHANAQDAVMSTEEYEEFVFRAGHLYDEDPIATWRKISEEQAKIVEKLSQYNEFRIVAEDTDLKLKAGGRRWINADGHENFPDGEVFTSPLEDSAEGHIKFTFPGIFLGKEAEGIRLAFEKGEVVEAEADKGKDYLRALIATDDGARRLGEFAFGTNYDIQNFTRNVLFDEKIGGTIHLALGASIPETGGKNVSGIHWDIVLNMRKGGEVYADGELIYRDGKFLL